MPPISKQINPARDSWNDEAFQRRLKKVKEVRDAKEKLRCSDITQSRIGSIMNLSTETTELVPIVSDGYRSKSRAYIYAHRANQGGTKKDENGNTVRRNEESFLKEMSQPKYMKMENGVANKSRAYKPGYIPISCRVESELDHITSDPREDVDASIEVTLSQTSIADSAEDKRHMSIHESLTRPLEHYFALTRSVGRPRNDNSMSGLGHYASATKSSAYRYAQSNNHSVMHSSGAEWWDTRDSEVATGQRGRTHPSIHKYHDDDVMRVRRRKSTADLQRECDTRRHGLDHDKRIAMLVTDYVLKPFSGAFIDRYGHHKTPGTHLSRRRSISLERGVMIDDYGSNVLVDMANLGAIAQLDHPSKPSRGRRGRSSSVGSRPRGPVAGSGGGNGNITWANLPDATLAANYASPVSSMSRKRDITNTSTAADGSVSVTSHATASSGDEGCTAASQSSKHIGNNKLREKGNRAKGRMTMIEELVPGSYRPWTGGSPRMGHLSPTLGM